MGEGIGELYMLNTCPFTWKVRALLDHLDLPHERIQVNPMKIKKSVAFAGDWGKTPVWKMSDGEVVVDSTPIMRRIDEVHNEGKLWGDVENERRDKWINWADTEIKNATIPILYGSIGSALSTTRSVAKHERFGLMTGRLYAWAGFPIMWGIIARKRAKNSGMKPQELWHHLLDEWINEVGNQPFFGGNEPDIVDLAVFGYMKSIELHNKAFRLIQEHADGMAWFNRMKNAAAKQ
ncbi:MAG: glutathione S-transferase family protein [Candidatus Thalassarchaeaceae archaeon]|jgi:microsomal prostaglandin-E synthase 2|nr:glutathione S-transferase family protein [Candidatus Thalassarchaeaceae archaeon]